MSKYGSSSLILVAALFAGLVPLAGSAADIPYFRMRAPTGAVLAPPSTPPAQGLVSYTVAGNSFGMVGAPYTSTANVSNATGPVAFAVAGGALPPGLSLDPSSGAVTGSAVEAGSFAAVLRALDTGTGTSSDVNFEITVDPEFVVSGPASVTATVDDAYSVTFAVSGGLGPYSFTTVSSLPPGLVLSADGTIAGTPSQGGLYDDIVVVAHDARGRSLAAAVFAIAVEDPLAVTAGSPPNGYTNVAYSYVPAVTGGSGVYTSVSVSNVSSSLAALGLQSGIVGNEVKIVGVGAGGRPTAQGSWTGAFTVTDSVGHTATSSVVTISIGAPLPLTLSGTALPAVAGTPYEFVPTIQGGTAPYVVSVTNTGAFRLSDVGLVVSQADGSITGTPTAGGTWTGTLSVIDAANASGTLNVSIAIAANGPPNVSGSAPSPYASGASYPLTTFVATGGAKPYTWSLTGDVPPGLSINPATGALSGTPTSAGTYTFNVVATGSDSAAGSIAQTVVISNTAFTITSANGIAGSIVNRSAGQTFPTLTSNTSNAVGAVTWTLSGMGGTGVTINSSTGAMSGTTSANYGYYNATVTGTDQMMQTSSYSFGFRLGHQITDGGNSAILKINGVQVGGVSTNGTAGPYAGSLNAVGQTIEVVFSKPVAASRQTLTATYGGAKNVTFVPSVGDGTTYTNCSANLVIVGGAVNQNSICDAVNAYTHWKYTISSISGTVGSISLGGSGVY